MALLLAIVVGGAIGALTAYGQEWLGDSTGSLANSAGPWSLTAFGVARWNRRVLPAVAAAAVTLACCELGYAIATEIRGGSNSQATVVFWLTAAVLAGPPLGIAAAWSRGTGLLRSVGFAVVGGVLLGEGLYGWTTVADTTDWRYWAVETVLGAAIIVAIAAFAIRKRRHADALAAAVMAAATAAVVFGAGRLA